MWYPNFQLSLRFRCISSFSMVSSHSNRRSQFYCAFWFSHFCWLRHCSWLDFNVRLDVHRKGYWWRTLRSLLLTPAKERTKSHTCHKISSSKKRDWNLETQEFTPYSFLMFDYVSHSLRLLPSKEWSASSCLNNLLMEPWNKWHHDRPQLQRLPQNPHFCVIDLFWILTNQFMYLCCVKREQLHFDGVKRGSSSTV